MQWWCANGFYTAIGFWQDAAILDTGCWMPDGYKNVKMRN